MDRVLSRVSASPSETVIGEMTLKLFPHAGFLRLLHRYKEKLLNPLLTLQDFTTHGNKLHQVRTLPNTRVKFLLHVL